MKKKIVSLISLVLFSFSFPYFLSSCDEESVKKEGEEVKKIEEEVEVKEKAEVIEEVGEDGHIYKRWEIPFDFFGVPATAIAIGEPYLIVVEDEAGETVYTFEDTPMQLALEYTPDEVASLDESSIADIAIYYFNVERNIYEYIGGVHDLDSHSVYSDITRSGEYVLAYHKR